MARLKLGPGDRFLLEPVELGVAFCPDADPFLFLRLLGARCVSEGGRNGRGQARSISNVLFGFNTCFFSIDFTNLSYFWVSYEPVFFFYYYYLFMRYI